MTNTCCEPWYGDGLRFGAADGTSGVVDRAFGAGFSYHPLPRKTAP